MKVLDLFSGIGGFSLGLERSGLETIAFCEIEDYPVSILNKHWPNVPVHRDIRKLDGKQYRNKIDVVCGGFPCQPFSVAGQQKGKEDDRHLWPEMLRIIKESKPTWVIGENVAGFISMALDDVLFDLEAEGYTTQSLVIPACAVGGIHRRDRVWIIGYSEHNGRDGTKDRQSYTSGNDRNTKGKIEACKSTGSGYSRGNDANTKVQRLQRRKICKSNEKIWPESNDKRFRRCSNEFGRSRKFEPIGLPTEPTVCRRNDGVPNRVARLKALGNSLCPEIPELIGAGILLNT